MGWYLKRPLLLGLAVFVIAQAFRIDKTNPPVQQNMAASPEIAAVPRRACYDCHSNETVWRAWTAEEPANLGR